MSARTTAATAKAGTSEAGPPALVVDAVTVRYPGGHLALDGASLTLPFATICGLVGPNGAGKSTLFKTVMGFIEPESGRVLIEGGRVRDAVRRNRIAYVPQSEEIDWTFPVLVEDVVMMGRYGRMGLMRRARAADYEAVALALERVGMSPYRRRQIGELSGGQRKRVFLARALAQEAALILLDEPFTGVDVKTEAHIVTLMRALRDEGRLLLVSTHNLGSVPDYCDRVVLINRRIIAAGLTAETFTQAAIEQAFGSALRHFRLDGPDLHDDADRRTLTVITDDERPAVFYGEPGRADAPRTSEREEPR